MAIRAPLGLFLTGLLAVLGAGCATSPISPAEGTVAAVGPAHVLAEQGHEGQRAIWGGRIVGVTNMAEFTELEVVGLPLDRGDRPRVEAEPGVRFLVIQSGFLEPTQYAAGRYVTVLGEISGLEERLVGDYVYDYPALIAEQIHLWPADLSRWQQRTRFSVGIGIRL